MEDRLLDHPLKPYPKLIINAAITGIVPAKEDTPNVPITPDEIARDAVTCTDLGACIVHIHARDHDGKPTYRKDVYADIISRRRSERPDLIICASTSGRVFQDPELRAEVLSLKGGLRPDMASLTLGSFNFPKSISPNPPESIAFLAKRMTERGIKLELEIFEAGTVNYRIYLLREGVLPNDTPPYFNIILGSLGSARANAGSLSHIVESLPEGAVWSACGVGRFQLPITMLSIAMGGGARVGIEDSIHYDIERKRLATNGDLVERVVRIARELGRDIATPSEAREMLGL